MSGDYRKQHPKNRAQVMEPAILFEDDALVVIDKPPGMIVYPDGKHDYPALSHWLEKKYKEPARPAGGHHFVNRIDRETSGVLVAAKTAEAHQFLKEQFQNREITKIYRAFIYGALKEERGVISKPIGSSRGGKGPRSATRPHGTMREASTVWKRLINGEGCSYIEAFPKTGRTPPPRPAPPPADAGLQAPGAPRALRHYPASWRQTRPTGRHRSFGR